MNKILIIEDDKDIVDYLCDFLGKEGFKVCHADGQSEGMRQFYTGDFDLVLLDISLNDGNGFSICTKIREKYKTPIIFLTANGDEGCMVAGFEMGADDYIAKPFRPRELLARIKNALRKNSSANDIMRLNDITVDTVKAKVTKNGTEIFLSALEYRLLLVFFTNKGVLMTRDRLSEDIWETSGEFVSDNTINVYIKRLREKIEDDPAHPTIIKTVRGLGYKAGD